MSSEVAQTGVLQFGEECPGIFIQGPNAIYYSIVLRDLLAKVQDKKSMANFTVEMLSFYVSNLANLLESCGPYMEKKVDPLYLKDFVSCKEGED